MKNFKFKKVAILVVMVLSLAKNTANIETSIAYAATNTSPSLNKKNLTVTEGTVFTLKVNNYKGKIKWVSENPYAIAVNNGKVICHKIGHYKINAVLENNKTLTCKVNVTEKENVFIKEKKIQKNYSEKTLKRAGGSLGLNLFQEKFYETDFFNDRYCQDICIDIKQSTNYGTYGYCDNYVEELPKLIHSVEELMAYFLMANYTYGEDNIGYMGMARSGWGTVKDARINLSSNRGVCAHTASVVAYLLEGDYDEIGFVFVNGSFGHEYNYIKEDGIYYLVDFTDYTANEDKLWTDDYESVWKEWKDNICFWSGKDLNSPEATKAVLIHDTYADNNVRKKLNYSFNLENTGAILAIKYYDGMYGTYVSYMTDQSNQQTVFETGIMLDGGYKVTYNDTIGIGLPEGTEYTVMFLNKTKNYCNAKWVELEPIPVELVPYFIKIPWDKESYFDKYLRQTSNYSYNLMNVKQVRIGKGWYMAICEREIYNGVNIPFGADYIKQWFKNAGINVNVY